MYSIDIIRSSINLYIKLKNENIVGKERIKFINSVFNIHINTLYKWLDKYYNKITNSFNFSTYKTNFKYNNLKITNTIEKFIIESMDTNNNFNIKNIRKNILNKFNVKLSKATIYFVLHKNNLTYKKMYIKNIPYEDENKLSEKKNNLKIEIKKVNDDNIKKLISYDEVSSPFGFHNAYAL